MGNPLITPTSSTPAAPPKVRHFRQALDTAFEKALTDDEYSDDEAQVLNENFGEFTPYLHEAAHRFARRKMTPVFDLAGALAILGQTSVVSYDQHLATFARPWPKDEPVFCPSIEQLKECAAQNAAGTNKWLLGFGSNLSFREQHIILGTDTNHKPNYRSDVNWFLEPNYTEVGDSKPQAGYYLIDMEPRWNRTNWQGQGNKIAALGEDYERTDERIFSQVVLAHQKATGQRLFKDQWHWGRILDSFGGRVCVRLRSDGLDVVCGHPSYADDDGLSVSVARKSRLRCLIA